MPHLVYADNAATTKLDTDAFEAMKPFLMGEYGNASQPYSFAKAAKIALKESRKIIATCVGASPEEIFFTSGGSESDNWAIKGSALTRFDDPLDFIAITSSIEHHAILRACADIEQLGFKVMYLPVDSKGCVHPETLTMSINNLIEEIKTAKQVTPKIHLVSIMMVNNEIGTIEDISLLAKIAHTAGAIFHTDAVQAVGHIPIDVNKLGVDMLSASAHKFNGPKGIGFLYIKKGTHLKPFITGGAQESNMRAGTENIASIVGMATALKKNVQTMNETSSRLLKLEAQLINDLNLRRIDFIRNGAERHLPGNISLSFPGHDGEALLHRLDLMGICVSTGAACDSQNTQISHVLKAINLDERYARGTIRISLGRNNSEEDIALISEALCKILKE